MNIIATLNATSSIISNSTVNTINNVASNATANSNISCSSTGGVISKIICNDFGKPFIHIKIHKCKINKNKNSFIVSSDTNDSFSLFHDSLLNMNTSDLSDLGILDSAFLSQVASKDQFSSCFSNDISSFIKKHKNKFSAGLLNINSLVSKMDDIAFILSKQFLDIFLINESK
jgi:hypothetical protein